MDPVADGEVERRVREGLPVLEFVARQLGWRLAGAVQHEDLVALGYPGLVDAARTWDPARARFAGYASVKVRWAMLDGVRRETRGRSTHARAAALIASERFGAALAEDAAAAPAPTEEAAADALSALLAGHATALALGLLGSSRELGDLVDERTGVDERVARAELAAELREVVATLPERERALVVRHYFEGESFDAVARDLGVSKSWASRLHAQAIRRLSAALAARVSF